MTICFFEDGGDRLFAPLTLTRPVDDLRIGILTIREKWNFYLKTDRIVRMSREPLLDLFPGERPAGNEDVIWINARWLPDEKASLAVIRLKRGQVLMHEGRVVAAKLTASKSRAYFDNGELPFDSTGETNNKETIETDAGILIHYLWNLLEHNESEIHKDIALLNPSGSRPPSDFPQAIFIKPENIVIAPGAKVDHGVIIDASGGPVYLGRDAHVMYGTVLQGPGALCEKSVLKMGSKVYPGSTIGPVCKVSGEIHNVIIHSHSNKAHDGYLGNSLIGEWCNLGANTTTSNLNNNYKPVKMPDWATGNIYKSPIQFFGTVMGDHGKTAINTSLLAGTLCGVFCNIFTYSFPPKQIPSFSWVGPDGIAPYQFEKAMETAEIMMKRRNVPFKRNYLLMLKYLFEHRDKFEHPDHTKRT